MTSQEQAIFFELLRAALWEREADLRVFQGDWSWERLLQAYQDHALMGVVAHTILNLPNNYQPDFRLQQFIFQTVGSLVQTRQKHNQVIATILSDFEQEGCHPVLLKGQGLASLYPSRCIRTIGDIDIYVTPSKYDVAKTLINKHADAEEISHAAEIEAEHHYKIKIEDVIFEIHHLAGDPGNPNYKKRFHVESAKYLTPEKISTAILNLDNGNKEIPIPSIQFNVWYIFNHLVHHFAGQGVGLRQFCDWFLVLKAFTQVANEEDYRNLKHILDSIGLMRAWRILGGILVNQFKFPSCDYPFYSEKWAEKSQGYILSEIVEGGNFRFQSYKHNSFLEPHGSKRIFNRLKNAYLGTRPLKIVSTAYSYQVLFQYILFGINGLMYRHFNVSLLSRKKNTN